MLSLCRVGAVSKGRCHFSEKGYDHLLRLSADGSPSLPPNKLYDKLNLPQVAYTYSLLSRKRTYTKR